MEAGEQAASRNLYAGRLTLDSLVERVGHSHFERLRERDLSGMRLKELGDVFTKEEAVVAWPVFEHPRVHQLPPLHLRLQQFYKGISQTDTTITRKPRLCSL